MADNYLGKKMEEYYARPAQRKTHTRASLEQLLLKNRSYRGYDPSYVVREDQLRRIIAVNTSLPSACNQQVLRFRAVLSDEANRLLPHLRFGGALSGERLPLAGREPRAFIIICSTVEEGRYVDIDLGISAQSMLLQAVEIGLNGICLGAFDREVVQREFALPYPPLLILALGKGAEQIRLTEIGAHESHNYYREEGVHYVPKVRLEELLLK